MKTKSVSDILSGFFLTGLAVFICCLSAQLHEETAKTFPLFISYTLGFLALLMIIKAVVQIKKETPVKPDINKGFLAPCIVMVFCVLFLFLFNKIGFEISGFGLMFGIMLFMNGKNAIRSIYIAIIVPVVMLLIFSIGLQLRLPLMFFNMFK